MLFKALRINNEIEYASDEFGSIYKKHGIFLKKIKPGTSQHNGVVETVNKTILENV